MLLSTFRATRALAFAGAAAGALVLQPSATMAQVGHVPSRSPYEDFKIGQSLSIMAGRLSVARDPADVAPQSGLLAAIRYDVGIGGPASFFARYAMAPSERKLIDPSKPRATRVIGTPSVTTHIADVGIDLALTGRKSYRRLVPSLYGSAGVASDFAGADTGAYRFGTNFAFTYGFSVRYVSRRGPQLRLDASRFLWQYQYPDRYFTITSDTTSVIRSTRNRSAWRGNWGTTLGVTIPIFR
jgi:hypothetical protein